MIRTSCKTFFGIRKCREPQAGVPWDLGIETGLRKTFLAAFIFAGLLLASPASAEPITYNVDISGTDTHELRVVGTITIDTMTMNLVESDLDLYHDSVFAVSFPSQPLILDAGFRWDATPTELRFERTSTDDGYVWWRTPLNADPFATFHLGSGTAATFMDYFLESPVTFDSVLLQNTGPPESPGYLVGVVPEPSSFLLLGVGLLGVLRQRRVSHRTSF